MILWELSSEINNCPENGRCNRTYTFFFTEISFRGFLVFHSVRMILYLQNVNRICRVSCVTGYYSMMEVFCFIVCMNKYLTNYVKAADVGILGSDIV